MGHPEERNCNSYAVAVKGAKILRPSKLTHNLRKGIGFLRGQEEYRR